MKEKIKKKYYFYFFFFCVIISLVLNTSCYFRDPFTGNDEIFLCWEKIDIFKTLKVSVGLFIFGLLSGYILRISEESTKKDNNRKQKLSGKIKI